MASACFECSNSIFFFKRKIVKKNNLMLHYWCQFLVNCILICLRCQSNPLIDLNMMHMDEHVNEMWSVLHFIPSHYIVTIYFLGLFLLELLLLFPKRRNATVYPSCKSREWSVRITCYFCNLLLTLVVPIYWIFLPWKLSLAFSERYRRTARRIAVLKNKKQFYLL